MPGPVHSFSILVKSRKGIALLVTLSVMAILVAITLELHKRQRGAVIESASFRDRVTLNEMAGSGIHIAMAMLVKDKNESEIDSIQEDWADPIKRRLLLVNFPFGDGSIDIDISDERSRIQINALVALPGNEFNEVQFHLWDHLLGFLKKEDKALAKIDHTAIINCIKDWIDSGDDDAITGLTGAESAYYLSLDPPYPARNGPIDHLGDLFHVKGITKELLLGKQVGFSLADFLTVYGAGEEKSGELTYDGKININTAPLPVIFAILPEDYSEYAPQIVDYRVEKSADQYVNALTGLDWYKNVPGLEDLKIDPNLITNVSDLFRIVCTARLHGLDQTVIAVVERKKGEVSGKSICRIIHWQTD